MGRENADLNRLLAGTLLILILVGGAYLRFVGQDWDVEQHLHPDERFLTMVESSLLPVGSLGEYFDTANSTLNPNNRGHSFFVYGTLPIFMVRYLGESIGSTGYGSIYLVGRTLSAVMDLLSVVLVFFIGARLYSRKVGIIGAAFSALAVLQIQQSHFFTVDTFITFFTLLTVYFAVEVLTAERGRVDLLSYLLFGAALGMAVASKINAVPVAVTLPLAAWIHFSRMDEERKDRQALRIVLYLILAAVVSLVVFRICQPYAFAGPGFFNIKLNENWVITLKSLHAQTSGDVDFPPALQWARRPIWFSLKNMVLWGLGLPYGILAWAGFIWMGWKIIRKRAVHPHLVLWAWTGAYFAWQTLQWNSTMRYQLPIYPLMGVFAAWLLVELWGKLGGELTKSSRRFWTRKTLRSLVLALGLVSLAATGAWAYAFSRIYTQDHPRVAGTRWIFDNIPGPASLLIDGEDGKSQQLISYPDGLVISGESPWLTNFTALVSGRVSSVYFPAVINEDPAVGEVRLQVSINDTAGQTLAAGEERISFFTGSSQGTLDLDRELELNEGETYQFSLAVLDPPAAISLGRVGLANESSWDDGLPLRMDGYDPYGGIYEGGLNFELYWDDNPEKLERFISTMEGAEYILITSSRQWASTTRVPERYPLTIEYYRQLMGCPLEISLEKCYNFAEPGAYQGALGFELVKTFQSNPSLGSWEINDQPAEEAFTVYDHPKVFVFKKSADFSAAEVRAILSAVDLDRVIHVTPKQADSHPGGLMLPADRLAAQRAGGTWSDFFDREAPQNRSQLAAAVLWYLAVFILGLVIYPLTRYLLPGLSDAGYPLSRTIGLLILSYLVWLAGSAGIPFTRVTILIVFLAVAGAGIFLAYRNRQEMVQHWDQSKRFFIAVEIIALALFVLALLIRFGNPDLWHPWKGGERPMDFSYFNAVIKSTTFPPYDPWFAGGYINYYYYGFVFVGVLTKLLGIMPSVAYNLILPTIFMMIGLGAFTIVWNLLAGQIRKERFLDLPFWGGIGGLLGMALFGNLGVLRMVFQGVQRLASGGMNVLEGGFFQRIKWTLLGLVQLFHTPTLGYRLDEWYWNPSRAIGADHGGPITEFPFFTFLYGDPHAHLFALPLTLLALAWILSIIKSSRSSEKGGAGVPLRVSTALFGALAVGVLRPTNTWDFYPYLALGAAALIYAGWSEWKRDGSGWERSALQLGIFLLFGFLAFQPYDAWYGEGYTSIKPWFGTHTPVNDYLIHWGLFLFIIVSWMIAESIDWMASTPVSALRKLVKIRELIIGSLLLLLVVMVSLGVSLENPVALGDFNLIGTGVHVVWFVLPLMAWALVLLLRPGQDLMKGLTLFLVGTALAITLMVELVYVEGDIGRMNTVFKFYLQAWTLFAVSAGAALCWLAGSLRRFQSPLKFIWQAFFYLLLISAALYPLLGGVAKIKDRMASDAPPSLDGMAFMEYATYFDLNTELDLSQDYDAIRWMQDHVPGSPVIVEANQVEYHWGTRYTVYTGLPGVVGWNWHQRQQRTLTPHDWVYSRVDDVNAFYDTANLQEARQFLEEYQVSYIILGQLERAKYLPEGIAKFKEGEGVLWEVVYQNQDTTIYQTLLND